MDKTILLADDSVTIQKVVELTFLDEGYRVVGVSNGTDALAKLRDVAPGIVIADIHMPGADGYEVARRTKAERPGTPVLLLVGTFEPFDRDRFAASGADAYLKKPFDSQELLRQVSSLIAGGGKVAAEYAPTQVLPRIEELGPLVPPAPAAPAPAAAPAPPLAIQETRWESFAVEEFDDEPPTAPLVDELAPRAAFVTPPHGTAIPAPAESALEPALGPSLAPGEAAAPRLSDLEIERVARRVVELMSDKVVREVAWEVVPDLAEVVVKARLREIEGADG
jgi:CheY-like chemotaxis protein